MSDDASTNYGSLKSRFSQLENDARLDRIVDEIREISESIQELPERIKSIRDRGYAFAAYLEHKAEVLRNHWEDIRTQISRSLRQEQTDLKQDLDDLEQSISRADNVENIPEKLALILPQVENAVERLEEKAKSAAERVAETYRTLKSNLAGTEADLTDIAWYCDMRDEASFEFLAAEKVFLAAKAEWVQTGKGGKDPDGIIFLTDQRMIFEQKEVTGKTLGLFGGKQQQEVEWEIPLNKVEAVEAEKKGLFGGKDMIHFTLGNGAPYPKITVEIKGGVDCKFWAAQVGRMMKGETNDERAIAPDPEMIEALRNAPTECHVCGGMLPKLVANQTQIDCEYCGAVIRIA